MKISDYIFKEGDEVISVGGIRGTIRYVCHCEKCAERGFFEPEWEHDDEYEHITNFEATIGFPGYYKIGDYYFHPLDRAYVEREIADREASIARLKKQLQVIDDVMSESELMVGYCPICDEESFVVSKSQITHCPKCNHHLNLRPVGGGI